MDLIGKWDCSFGNYMHRQNAQGKREKGKEGGRENNLIKNLSNNAIQEKTLPPSGITMRTKATDIQPFSKSNH